MSPLRLRRRRRPKPTVAAVDPAAFLALPAAVGQLRHVTGLSPTGVGSVCLKRAEGGVNATVDTLMATADIDGQLGYDETTDAHGYTWLTCRTDPPDLPLLVAELDRITSTLTAAGFGSAALCAVIAFSDGRLPPVGLVYLYSRGSWYPFVPVGPTRRDNVRELAVRDMLGDELSVEADLARWSPLWGAPGL